MAILKHIASKNADYGEAERYLIFQHDEYTQKPILDDSGNMLLREEYYLEGINCDPFTFDAECRETNAFFHKNQSFNEIKSHHYIISFDPKEDLDSALSNASAQSTDARNTLKSTEDTLKSINEQIHYTGQYLANKSIYSDYRKSRNKEKFYDDHRAELTLYESSLRILKEKAQGKKLSLL